MRYAIGSVAAVVAAAAVWTAVRIVDVVEDALTVAVAEISRPGLRETSRV